MKIENFLMTFENDINNSINRIIHSNDITFESDIIKYFYFIWDNTSKFNFLNKNKLMKIVLNYWKYDDDNFYFVYKLYDDLFSSMCKIKRKLNLIEIQNDIDYLNYGEYNES